MYLYGIRLLSIAYLVLIVVFKRLRLILSSLYGIISHLVIIAMLSQIDTTSTLVLAIAFMIGLANVKVQSIQKLKFKVIASKLKPYNYIDIDRDLMPLTQQKTEMKQNDGVRETFLLTTNGHLDGYEYANPDKFQSF